MRRTQFTSLPWLFVVVPDPHSRPKQAWAPEWQPLAQFIQPLPDDRELANTILGERTVDAMFGKTDPVRVTTSSQ